MEFAELNDFSLWEARRQEDLFGKTNQEMILVNSLKLSEEVGETMNEVQNLLRLQRKEKLDSPEVAKKKLAEEISDVIIISSILAKRCGIDLEDAVTNKMEIVRARKYK